MTKEQLLALGLTEEQTDKVLELKGQAIKPFTDENTKLKSDIEAIKIANSEHVASIQSMTAELEKFKGLDVEALKGEAAKVADEWKAKLEQAEKDAAAKVAALTFDGILRDKLAGVKFTSEFAKQGVMNTIREKGLKIDNGAILGLDDALKALRESSADAFAPDADPSPSPNPNPAPPPMYAGAGRQEFHKPTAGEQKFPFAFNFVRPAPDVSTGAQPAGKP